MLNSSTSLRLFNLEKQAVARSTGTINNIPEIKTNTSKRSYINIKIKPHARDTIKHQVIITPDVNTKFTNETFADKVKGHLSEVPIKKLTVTKSELGVLEFPSTTVREKAMSRLENFNVQCKTGRQKVQIINASIQMIILSTQLNQRKN